MTDPKVPVQSIHGGHYRTATTRVVPTTFPFIENLINDIYIYKHFLEKQHYEAALTRGEFALSTPEYFKEHKLGVRSDEKEGAQTASCLISGSPDIHTRYLRQTVIDSHFGEGNAADIVKNSVLTLTQRTQPACLMSFTMRPNPNTTRKFGNNLIAILDPVGFKWKIDTYLKRTYGAAVGDMRSVTYYTETESDLAKKLSTHPAYLKPVKTDSNNYSEEHEFRMLWPVNKRMKEKHDFTQPLIVTIPELRDHLVPIPASKANMKGYLSHTVPKVTLDNTMFPPSESIHFTTHCNLDADSMVARCRSQYKETLNQHTI